MNPDLDSEGNSEFDDAYADADETTQARDFEVFNGTEEEELSEVGRVRNDPKNTRYAPY
jgi:nucleotide-sensitive chloride channel 1A